MAFRVIDGGIETTVQDLGRPGHYHNGFPPSGALDQLSFLAANWLVGNDENAAGLECVFVGPKLEVTEPTVIAVTGADIQPRVNGDPVPLWTAVPVRAGDLITFDMCRGGARLYIAVAGGIDVVPRLGSRSTYALCRIGGHEGRPLKAGDELPTGRPPQSADQVAGRSVPESLRPQLGRSWELRMVQGLFAHRVEPDSMKEFYACEWTVSREANRIGYRLSGRPITFIEQEQPFGAGSDPSNIVDAGYPIGSIQVPSGIEPIILLNDAVTGGGYATIGTVISADLRLLAQAKPNDKVVFRPISINGAVAARAELRRRIDEIRNLFN